MLKNSLMFMMAVILTACHQVPGWHKTLPAINFNPEKTIEMQGKLQGNILFA